MDHVDGTRTINASSANEIATMVLSGGDEAVSALLADKEKREKFTWLVTRMMVQQLGIKLLRAMDKAGTTRH